MHTHMHTQTLQQIADYLRFRQIPLDPAPVAAYLEHQGIAASLFTIESDCDALLDRFDTAVYDDFLPTRAGRREAEALISAARQDLLAHIEQGHVDGEHAELDGSGNGCLLAILADVLDRHWSFLRLCEDDPLLIERFVYGVRPGDTHQTHPALALLHTWIPRAAHRAGARRSPRTSVTAGFSQTPRTADDVPAVRGVLSLG